MSDQSRIDKLIEKYLHCWSVFLAVCGRLWDRVKACTGKTVAFLRRCADLIAESVGKACDVAAFYVRKVLRKVRGWMRRKWNRYIKPLLQKLAAWLLKIREKAQPGIRKVKGWFAAAAAWFAAQKEKIRKRLPEPEPRELPPVEEPAMEEPAAETAVPVPVEEVPAVQPQAEEPVRQNRITNPTLAKIVTVLGAIGKYVKLVIKWIWKLRSVFLCIPVVWAAVKLAMLNMARLPESVGFDIQASGEFARMITREQAVYGPLALTLFCLVLTLCAKKPLLPWVISIFTLVLPVLIWVLNYYA